MYYEILVIPLPLTDIALDGAIGCVCIIGLPTVTYPDREKRGDPHFHGTDSCYR